MAATITSLVRRGEVNTAAAKHVAASPSDFGAESTINLVMTAVVSMHSSNASCTRARSSSVQSNATISRPSTVPAGRTPNSCSRVTPILAVTDSAAHAAAVGVTNDPSPTMASAVAVAIALASTVVPVVATGVSSDPQPTTVKVTSATTDPRTYRWIGERNNTLGRRFEYIRRQRYPQPIRLHVRGAGQFSSRPPIYNLVSAESARTNFAEPPSIETGVLAVRVLITGGTGFVGSHVTKKLLAAHHDVRLLVRDPQKAERVFAALSIDTPEIVVGDATDAGAIRTAMTGCDAVVHAAAVVSMERKAAAPMYRTNTNAAELVLTEAVRQKLDPIINISSAAVFQLDGPSISLSTPLRMADSWYSRSKVEVERFARGMQVAGAPVVSLYPSGVFGPLAPEVTTMHGAAVTWIQNMPIMPSGINIVDVDDVATAVTRAMSPGQGPRSFMLGGHFVAWKELANIIEEMTGVKLKRMVVPGSLLRGLGRFSDATRIRLSRDFPLTTEAMNEATRGIPIDSAESLKALGMAFTDRWTTLRQGYEWLVREGHVAPEFAGRLAVPR